MRTHEMQPRLSDGEMRVYCDPPQEVPHDSKRDRGRESHATGTAVETRISPGGGSFGISEGGAKASNKRDNGRRAGTQYRGGGGLCNLEFVQFKFCTKCVCAMCSVLLRICAGIR